MARQLKEIDFTRTATIAASGTTTEAIELGDRHTLESVVMPSAWTTADIYFQVSDSLTGTFRDVYDADGDRVTISSPAADRFITLFAGAIQNFNYIKLVSQNTQTAERVLTLGVRYNSMSK